VELKAVPIYEYECKACQHRVETLQKISDEPLKMCPACGKPELKKLVSAAAFRLKGGGWYETDFKTGNKKNLSSDAGGDGGGKSDKGAAETTAAKPAAAPAAASSAPAAKDSK
jgi:putative FmdB family regulatory protein